MASNDTEMNASGVGANSGINYLADFEAYKKIIICSRVQNPGWYKLLMATWNEKVFPKKRSPVQVGSEDDHDGLNPADEGAHNAVEDIFKRMAIANKGGLPTSATSDDSEIDNVIELPHDTVSKPNTPQAISQSEGSKRHNLDLDVDLDMDQPLASFSAPKPTTVAPSARQPRAQAFAPLPASVSGSRASSSEAIPIASSSSIPIVVQPLPTPNQSLTESDALPKKTRSTRKVAAATDPPAPPPTRATRSRASGSKTVRGLGKHS